MLNFEPWKKALIALVVFGGLLQVVPNFFYADVIAASDARETLALYEGGREAPPAEVVAESERWPSWLPSGVVNLGLDLHGGAHFLLEVQVESVFADRMEGLGDEIGPRLREAEVRRYRVRRAGTDSALVTITNVDDIAKAETVLEDLIEPVANSVLGAGQANLLVEKESEQVFRLTLTDAAKKQITDLTMAAAIEVVRTRVDALGTREPTIQRQGDDRILLQLPGVSSVNVEELTKVAKLEFQRVADEVNPVTGPIPRDVEVLEFDPELNPDRVGERIAVYKRVEITGDELADASQGFDQNGVVGVNIRFDAAGARTFGRLSQQVGSRFAMVLDGLVLSAPVFRVYIPDGRAIITGQFTVESANALAVNLRSGNLPTALTVEESSFVGPELGADSIEAGKIAAIVGFVAVMIYMALSYGFFGLMADLALVINVCLIVAVLSLFGATLTLPGIAGIVLTIGMAVDANVLIFERIREEQRRGRGVLRAIETGYQRAFSAIIDANVTTFLAALILFALGSGPVRGFAVTLGAGIVTSVFTAVFLTRFFVASWYDWKRPKSFVL